MNGEADTVGAAPAGDDDVAALANRLRKNARHLQRWARREGLDAWRVYERDVPEFPYAIDRYGDWLHVQLYDGRRAFTDLDIARHLSVIGAALEIEPARIVLKIRRRQRGTSQYEKLDLDGPSFTVHERGHAFEINLYRYLDSGLFLDHRETRRLVAREAAGRRFLNLFAYTGSFTVYARRGGAVTSTTVDLSRTYQDWTRRNLALNGLGEEAGHRLVAADVLGWLVEAAARGERYDLIVLDPPSFSNSKRMQDSFDVQRDQGQLLRRTLALLAPGGALYFSNNRQGFKLDAALAREARYTEITHQTVPEDFKRRAPHRCWRVTRD